MARMLPPYCSEDIQSAAEKRIFEMLRHDPDTADWICLHSLGLSRHVRQMYGEIDFVVLVPDEGVFCLEVKGGRVGRQDGQWTFTNRYGETTKRVKSPFMQARDGMFTLQRAITDHFGERHRLAGIAYGYGVLFPDILWEQEDPEYEYWQIYDRDFRRPISSYIRQLARHTHTLYQQKPWYRVEEARPTSTDIQELTTFLRGDFEAVVKPATQVEGRERDLIRLTQEQFHCLDALQYNPRCLFEGGAGTGKTLLAIEYARREAERGRSVLFLCYNRLLGCWLEAGLPTSRYPTVQVSSFHRYLDRLIERSTQANRFKEWKATRHTAKDVQVLYNQDYPLFALDALAENVVEPFDTLIIDEGQDLICSEYLDVLNGLLRGGLTGGTWSIFCDFHRQAIYADATGEQMRAWLQSYAPHHLRYALTTNCRNTRPIIEETAAMSGFKTPPCLPSLIDGVSVEYAFYRDAAHQRELFVQRLRQQLADGFAPEQISILSRVKRENSFLATLPEGLPCRVESLDENNLLHTGKGTILFSTVHAYKGLENMIVFLTDVERLEGSMEAALLYVGMSRARHRLVMLVSQAARSEYSSAVRRKVEKEIATS